MIARTLHQQRLESRSKLFQSNCFARYDDRVRASKRHIAPSCITGKRQRRAVATKNTNRTTLNLAKGHELIWQYICPSTGSITVALARLDEESVQPGTTRPDPPILAAIAYHQTAADHRRVTGASMVIRLPRVCAGIAFSTPNRLISDPLVRET